jgi:hypothetical protein
MSFLTQNEIAPLIEIIDESLDDAANAAAEQSRRHRARLGWYRRRRQTTAAIGKINSQKAREQHADHNDAEKVQKSRSGQIKER